MQQECGLAQRLWSSGLAKGLGQDLIVQGLDFRAEVGNVSYYETPSLRLALDSQIFAKTFRASGFVVSTVRIEAGSHVHILGLRI